MLSSLDLAPDSGYNERVVKFVRSNRAWKRRPDQRLKAVSMIREENGNDIFRFPLSTRSCQDLVRPYQCQRRIL